jgi:hypothetical protein
MKDETPVEDLAGKSYNISIPIDNKFLDIVGKNHIQISRMGTATVINIHFDTKNPNILSAFATIEISFSGLPFKNEVVKIELATRPLKKEFVKRPPIEKEELMKIYGSTTPEEAMDQFIKMTIGDIESTMKTTPKPINPGDTFPFSNPFQSKNSPPNNFSPETAAGQARVMGISRGKSEDGLTKYTVRYELTFKDFPEATTSRTAVFSK